VFAWRRSRARAVTDGCKPVHRGNWPGVLWIKWPYTLSVIVGDAWPRRRLTVRTSTPDHQGFPAMG
jgi:hypothetical protein